ncbi:MAG: hypothetical protein EOO77_44205 [Oxalobacteraceae bacterium]|nr:MAG: hypothetical protein EOO77_44205 [Oxalobacteraceae bacterium]
MAEFFECEDAKDLARMPFRLNLRTPRDATTFLRVAEMREWLLADQHAGEFTWEFNNDLDRSQLVLAVGFTDENTAFHFKVKFA